MAGDWIKFDIATPWKPETFDMAEILGIDTDSVVGKLTKVWAWANQNCNDGTVTAKSFLKQIDTIAGCNGFGQAMLQVGWLAQDSDQWIFPKFDRHNGQSAKSRAVTKKRVSKHRAQNEEKCNAGTVTDVTPTPLPEKRREEKSINVPLSARVRATRWPIEDVLKSAHDQGIDYEIATEFWHDCEAADWLHIKTGQPLGSMPSALHKYARNWDHNLKRKTNGHDSQDRSRNRGTANAGRGDEYSKI